jgi:hypothetical protein
MGDVIQLHDTLPPAQLERARRWAEEQLSLPAARTDRSLCQDLAGLMNRIDMAAWLTCGVRPANQLDAMLAGEGEEKIFAELYRGAEQLLWKAVNEYPDTQALGRKRKRKTKC